MSFSGKVKEELLEHYARARHCDIAELSAIVHMCGAFGSGYKGVCCLKVHTENLGVARKCFTLLEKTFNIKNDIVVRRNAGKDNYSYYIYAKGEELMAIRDTIVQAVCCKRAYIRGAFIASGSMSDPSKSYHFEIVCASMGKAQQIQKIMRCFALDAKIVSRKKSFVVYLKEGAQIVDVLNVMEAHQSLMELENIRILKDMRNTVNRKVNCETANINKTVSAAVKQIDDIRYIEETKGLDKLPEGLKDMALTRLTYPEASLKELGALLQNPVGKSGVNHRLRKLSEMAEEIRAKQGGTL